VTYAGIATLTWVLVAVAIAAVAGLVWFFVRRYPTVEDLWSVLRPLLLPLLGIAVVAAFAFGELVGWLAVLVLGAVGVLLVVRLNARSSRAALGDAGVVVIFLIVPTLFLNRAHGEELVWLYDLFSGVLLYAAFGLWVAVFGLRLLAFAVTPLRRVFAAVLAAAYVRFFLGLFVKGPLDLAVADFVVWPLLLLLLLVWLVRSEHDATAPEPSRTLQRLHRLGLSAAVVSAVAFACAGLVARMEPLVEQADVLGVVEVKDSPDLQRPDIGDVIDDPAQLVHRFSPVLELTADQPWAPIPVDSYLERADLHELVERKGQNEVLGRPLEPRPLSEDDLVRHCPVDGERKCVLTIRCTLDDIDEDEADQAKRCDHPDDPEAGYSTSGTAYTRVVYDRPDPPEGAAELTDPERKLVFAPVGPYAGRTSGPYAGKPYAIVQYWLFYYYDDWRAQTLFGNLRQSHEADWEVVSVVFDRDRPLFVALSSHCGGTWVPWERSRVANLSEVEEETSHIRRERMHPVVGVAEGSQANYYALSQNVPPNWARCSEIGTDKLEVATGGFEVRDKTGADTVIRPADLRPAGNHNIMEFHGEWGWNAVMHFETEFKRRHQIEKTGATAKTPTLQPLWYRTIDEIFCGKAWDRAGGGPEPPPARCPKKRPKRVKRPGARPNGASTSP
jgi:hypothetical protein